MDRHVVIFRPIFPIFFCGLSLLFISTSFSTDRSPYVAFLNSFSSGHCVALAQFRILILFQTTSWRNCKSVSFSYLRVCCKSPVWLFGIDCTKTLNAISPDSSEKKVGLVDKSSNSLLLSSSHFSTCSSNTSSARLYRILPTKNYHHGV